MNPMIKENHDAYEVIKHELEAKHMGRIVLMYRGKVVDIYDSEDDAYDAGCDSYGAGNFAIKVIGKPPIHLGLRALDFPG